MTCVLRFILSSNVLGKANLLFHVEPIVTRPGFHKGPIKKVAIVGDNNGRAGFLNMPEKTLDYIMLDCQFEGTYLVTFIENSERPLKFRFRGILEIDYILQKHGERSNEIPPKRFHDS